MKSHKFLEDVAIADVAFEAKGSTLNEVFEACADAVFDTMVDVKTLGDSVIEGYVSSNENLEKLLYDFLEEIVYLKDVNSVLFKESKVEIVKNNGKYVLKVKFVGDLINPETQSLKVDVKAVTMHRFSLIKEKGVYKASVVLDI